MIRTSNYNLGLWEGSDFPNYTMPNENMNIIDTNLKTVDERSVEAKSKADACISRLGNVDVQQMQEDVNANKVGVITNKALIDKLDDSIGTITSPTKEEVGTRIVREVSVSLEGYGAYTYEENYAMYGGYVEVTPDRLGLEVGDEIKVLSVTPTTTYKPHDTKNTYLPTMVYVGKKDNGNHCLCSFGITPNPNNSTNVYVLQPTGFIIEYIKL